MLARLPRSPNISFHFSSHLHVVMFKTKLRLDVKLSVYLMACKGSFCFQHYREMTLCMIRMNNNQKSAAEVENKSNESGATRRGSVAPQPSRQRCSVSSSPPQASRLALPQLPFEITVVFNSHRQCGHCLVCARVRVHVYVRVRERKRKKGREVLMSR